MTFPESRFDHPQEKERIVLLFSALQQLESLDQQEQVPTAQQIAELHAQFTDLYGKTPGVPHSLDPIGMFAVTLPIRLNSNQKFNREFIYPTCRLFLWTMASWQGLSAEEFGKLWSLCRPQSPETSSSKETLFKE